MLNCYRQSTVEKGAADLCEGGNASIVSYSQNCLKCELAKTVLNVSIIFTV